MDIFWHKLLLLANSSGGFQSQVWGGGAEGDWINF